MGQALSGVQQESVLDSQLDSRLNLLDLPNELLERIFDEAYHWEAPSQPLCRALLPFFRRARLRQIRISTFLELNQLIALVKAQPNVAHHIRKLDLPDIPSGNASRRYHCPSDEDFVAFIRSLPRLTRLYIDGSELLCAAVLKDYIPASASPSHLCHLELVCAWGHLDRVEANWPDWYRAKHAFKPSPRFRRGGPTIPPRSEHLTSLSLGYCCDSRRLRDLLSRCPNLEHLSLWDANCAEQFPRLLDSLANPGRLRTLTCKAWNEPSWSITAVLPNLTSLTSLSLSRGHLPDPSFDAALRLLPLHTLALEPNNSLSPSSLLALVDGPERHSTLRVLRVNFNVYNGRLALRGTSILDKSPPFDSHSGTYTLHGDWRLARWPGAFSRVAFYEVVEAAERGGVQFASDAFDAAKVEDDYDEEKRALQAFVEAQGRWNGWGGRAFAA
ncbi:hypothetical protein JCM10213_002780 [Rhodosporidiobolus nylandii]